MALVLLCLACRWNTSSPLSSRRRPGLLEKPCREQSPETVWVYFSCEKWKFHWTYNRVLYRQQVAAINKYLSEALRALNESDETNVLISGFDFDDDDSMRTQTYYPIISECWLTCLCKQDDVFKTRFFTSWRSESCTLKCLVWKKLNIQQSKELIRERTEWPHPRSHRMKWTTDKKGLCVNLMHSKMPVGLLSNWNSNVGF